MPRRRKFIDTKQEVQNAGQICFLKKRIKIQKEHYLTGFNERNEVNLNCAKTKKAEAFLQAESFCRTSIKRIDKTNKSANIDYCVGNGIRRFNRFRVGLEVTLGRYQTNQFCSQIHVGKFQRTGTDTTEA